MSCKGTNKIVHMFCPLNIAVNALYVIHILSQVFMVQSL